MKLLALFTGFAKVGALGFGGGPAMLPLMEAECVRAGWVTPEQFMEGLAAGNALPGPISTKMAIYIGYQEAGAAGAVSALAGVIAPSGLAMGLLVGVLVRYSDHRLLKAALAGARPAVVGMLAFVAYDLGRRGISGAGSALAAVLAFVALERGVHPAIVMIVALVGGLVFFRG